MPLKITTWNINSVRLRIDLVAKFLKSARPDVLCLQETKCPDDAFPLKRFKRLGYEHAALNGQKGYHGVAVLARRPFESFSFDNFCGKTDCRHVKVVLGARAGLKEPITLHNFYVPAGGDERFAGSRQCLAIREHDRNLRGGYGVQSAGRKQVLPVRDVDDSVGVRGRLLEPVEILEVAAAHLRAERGHRRGGRVRPGQAGDLVPGGDELLDDVRTGMAGPAGDENAHATAP